MIPVPSGARVWLAAGHTDMRNERMGCGVRITNGLDRVCPMACPFGRACRIDVSGWGPGAIAFRDGRPVMDILRGFHASTCVTVR